MTTFDLAEVRGFAADLDARMDRCDNGEGMACARWEDALKHYAALCCEFRLRVREWGRAVFVGRVPLDPEVDRVLREEGRRLYARASEMAVRGQQAEAEVPCFILDERGALRAALWDLHRLLSPWVTPGLAVGPSARHEPVTDPAEIARARERLDALPPLPADWQPTDPRLQQQFRQLRASWSHSIYSDVR